MSAFPTDILIAKVGGRPKLENAAYQAKVLQANSMLQHIADRNRSALISIPSEVAKDLEDILSLLELRCLDLSVAWRLDVRSSEGIEFCDCCSLAFDIRRVLPLSKTDETRVIGAIHLAALGILGNRSADIRRYLNENDWPVPNLSVDDAGWPKHVLFKVADAFLRVVRKNNWDDLRAVADAISELRKSQLQYEKKYLERENGLRQAAALELVAFYHLAKAVEMLGVFVGKGTPRTGLDDVDFHLLRAVKAADSAGIIELALLLRWLSMAARVIIRSTIWHQTPMSETI
jgi:hypothetical protein